MNQTFQQLSQHYRQLMDQTAIDNLSTAVLLLDRNLNLVRINQSAESLFELSEKRALDKPLSFQVPGWLSFEPLLREALKNNQLYTQRQAQI